MHQPICSQCTLSLPPENIRKPYGSLMFPDVEKECIGNKSVNITSSRKGFVFLFFWMVCQAKHLNALLCLMIFERFLFHVSYTTSLITFHPETIPWVLRGRLQNFDSPFDFPFSFQRNIVIKIFLQKRICFTDQKELRIWTLFRQSSISEVLILMALSLVS